MIEKTYQWNAGDYAAHSSAQLEWARELIAKLNLRGNECLLDIGCGDGKISAGIAECLTEGRVTGIDSSRSMIDLAKESYPESRYRNLSFILSDVQDMALENEFDVVFSNAALHWIKDHFPVLQKIKQALKPSGKLLLQMGGKGNAQEIISILDDLLAEKEWEPYFAGFSFPYGFYDDVYYKELLANVGLEAQRVELIPKVMIHRDRDSLAGWIRTTWLPYTERIPSGLRENFINEVIDMYLAEKPVTDDGSIRLQMVRLEVEAIKRG